MINDELLPDIQVFESVVLKRKIQDNIREVIAKERMLKGMVMFFKMEDMILDVLPDLFVHLMSTQEGCEILNRMDKNGKIAEFIGEYKS